MKEKIAKWYEQGLWTLNMVKDAVKKNVIKEKEYLEITGEDYIVD